MATPLSFTPYLGWVDATDPNNIPADLKLIKAEDLLRYEAFGRDATARINTHDATIGQHDTTLNSLQNTVSGAGGNTSKINTLTNTVAAHDITINANLNDITNLKKPRALATKTVSYALAQADSVIIGNGAAVTLTLPKAVDSGSGKMFTVKNLNAASLTVNVVAGGGAIDGVATKVLATGAFATFISDGVNWLVIG